MGNPIELVIIGGRGRTLIVRRAMPPGSDGSKWTRPRSHSKGEGKHGKVPISKIHDEESASPTEGDSLLVHCTLLYSTVRVRQAMSV
jgi:hypothetical protein